MTQDEHDAKCWQLLKMAIAMSQTGMSREAKEASRMLQSMMATVETMVDAGARR